MRARVTITHDDLFSYRIRDASETIDLFGEDYLIDYGKDIPHELLEEYREVMVKYRELQEKIKKYY